MYTAPGEQRWKDIRTSHGSSAYDVYFHITMHTYVLYFIGITDRTRRPCNVIGGAGICRNERPVHRGLYSGRQL